MTDANRPDPAPTDAVDGPGSRPPRPEPATPRDPTAKRDPGGSSGVESPGAGGGADPDGLDQSVGRGDAAGGDARTRDGAI